MRSLRLLSVLLVACSPSLVEGMDGLDTSQAKVLDMVGTWDGSAAADVLARGADYVTWRVTSGVHANRATSPPVAFPVLRGVHADEWPSELCKDLESL